MILIDRALIGLHPLLESEQLNKVTAKSKFCSESNYIDYNSNEIQKQSPEVFCKKGVLKILQNSQENTCARV